MVLSALADVTAVCVANASNTETVMSWSRTMCAALDSVVYFV